MSFRIDQEHQVREGICQAPSLRSSPRQNRPDRTNSCLGEDCKMGGLQRRGRLIPMRNIRANAIHLALPSPPPPALAAATTLLTICGYTGADGHAAACPATSDSVASQKVDVSGPTQRRLGHCVIKSEC
ncbi:hypothetical protein B0H12DRAFT_548219 [Mycena haematopus]|nr:hypothetical protein B0H12DRAFT_548219 [Mycena haematopus]